MKTLAIAILAISMAVAVDPVVGRAQKQAPTAPLEIREFVHQLYIEGVPYEEVIRFDLKTAVPTLLSMLADRKEEEHWPNIVITLGMLGDEQAVDPLIRFLEQSSSGQQVSRAHYIAKSNVMLALGYAVNRSGSQKALAYLRSSLNPNAWKERGLDWASPHHQNIGNRNLQLTQVAILGLALSGRPQAADDLRALQQPATNEAEKQFRAQVSNVVSTALNEHRIISREGLVKYYRRVAKHGPRRKQ